MSPPAKRIKASSTRFEADRSQSPIYSELGFEEVIRMVDERQSLDDEDLLEILTCPSPVWWEDPPDDRYVEGPITLKSSKIISASKSCNNNCLPAKPIRTKTSRKTRPHKLLIENTEATIKLIDDITDKIIDASTFNNISKPDERFSNKRSKLETLLSSIKNKIKDDKHERITNKEANKIRDIKETHTKNKKIIIEDSMDKRVLTNCEEVADVEANTSEKQSDIENDDDITFADITEQDNDCLTYLENIKIPIEGEENKIYNINDIKSEEKSCINIKKSSNTNVHMKTIKKSKIIPRFVTSKKLKILNIKKITTNNVSIKKQIRNETMKEKSKTDGITVMSKQTKQTIIQQDDIKSEIEILDDIKDTDLKSKSDHTKENVKTDIDEINKKFFNNCDGDDLVTVFKIISNDTHDINEEKIDTKEAEENDKDSNTLDCYYKKCKNSKWESNNHNKEETRTKQNKEDGTKEELRTIKQEESDETDKCQVISDKEDDCNKDTKIMIVPSTDVKYCLKCSSIFDLDECEYCIRQERKMEHSGTLP